MKRLLCLLLSAVLLISLCACAGKKDEGGKGSSEEPKTAEKTQTDKGEEVVTAPEKDKEKDDAPVEIGTLPIIFEDGNNEQKENDGGSTPPTTTGTNTPTTTTKKPESANKPTTTTKNPLNNSGVVETPIIPFN